jgi:arylsulfatase A-like enzyme
VGLVDVAPSLLDLAGAPALPHATGRSLLPRLRGADAGSRPGPPDDQQAVYAEIVPGLGSPPARMVRRGAWKLVAHHGYHTPQLFNLEDDPGELEDRGADPACAAVREELLDLAHRGWSGEVIEETLRRRAEDQRLLGAWYRARRPPDPDYWPARPEQTVFPEP